MKKLILIVNYKKKIEETETYRSLKYLENELKKMNYHIFIWDNCFLETNKKLLKKNSWIEYKETVENYSLSSIYNYVIENRLNDYDYCIILDNDSSISLDYFLKLEEAFETHREINLFLPKVMIKGEVFSPQKIFYEKLRKNQKIDSNFMGKIEAKDITAINSGMAISSNYLIEKFEGYDKRMGFYNTDNFLMLKYQKDNKYMYVLDYVMKHDLSMEKKENIETAIWRFRDQIQGMNVLSESLNTFGKIIIKLKIWNLTLKNSWKYRTMKFIKNSRVNIYKIL